jgi:hypothetical protein
MKEDPALQRRGAGSGVMLLPGLMPDRLVNLPFERIRIERSGVPRIRRL